MRSIFYKQPLQYQIEIDGENWTQGEKIKGKVLEKFGIELIWEIQIIGNKESSFRGKNV